MKWLVRLLLFLCTLCFIVDAAKPTRQQLQWQELEIGAMVSFNMWTFNKSIALYSVPPISNFNPTELSTDSWAEAALAMKAKYMVLTAKHDAGFCLWPTDYPGYTYSVKYTEWGNGQRDILAEFVASCQKYGLKPAFYYSIATNFYKNVQNGKPVNESYAQWQEYNKICLHHLSEIWSSYGDLLELWFDGGLIPVSEGGPNVTPLIQKYQPNAMVFNAPKNFTQCIRWIGNEAGVAPDPNWSTCTLDGCVNGGNGAPKGNHWCPAEVDTPIRGNGRHDWFWYPDGGLYVKTIDQLFDEYKKSVGRNANYLLNINPNQLGTIDQVDMERYQEFGLVISSLDKDNAIAATKGSGTQLILEFSQPTYIDHIVIQEDQTNGQNVRLYVHLGQLVDGTWEMLVNGSSIGHKKIDPISPSEVTAIKWMCLDCIATPKITFLGGYFIGPV